MGVLRDGSVVAVWVDTREDPAFRFDQDLFAQRISSAGVPQWGPTGAKILDGNGNANGQVEALAVLPDSADGCIIVIRDTRALSANDLTLLRLMPDAQPYPGWESGRGVGPGPAVRRFTGVVPRDSGDFYLTFWKSSVGRGTWAQRYDASGVPRWGAEGVRVVPNDLVRFTASDGSLGGLGVGLREDPSDGLNTNIVAQRFGSSGELLWGPTGVLVCSALGNQTSPSLAHDGSGGAFVAWEDERNGVTNVDIYAQHINADGTLGGAVTAIAVTAVSGARQGGCAELEWRTTESAGVGFELERSHDGGSWAPLARLFADGEGRVRWRECGLSPQAALAYRLSWRTASGTRTTSPITLPPEDAMTLTLSIANPVSERATIEYTLPEGAEVKLEVFDIAGRRLATPVAGPRAAGAHRLEWPARGAQSDPLAPGAYVARLTAGGETRVVRLIVAR